MSDYLTTNQMEVSTWRRGVSARNRRSLRAKTHTYSHSNTHTLPLCEGRCGLKMMEWFKTCLLLLISHSFSPSLTYFGLSPVLTEPSDTHDGTLQMAGCSRRLWTPERRTYARLHKPLSLVIELPSNVPCNWENLTLTIQYCLPGARHLFLCLIFYIWCILCCHGLRVTLIQRELQDVQH